MQWFRLIFSLLRSVNIKNCSAWVFRRGLHIHGDHCSVIGKSQILLAGFLMSVDVLLPLSLRPQNGIWDASKCLSALTFLKALPHLLKFGKYSHTFHKDTYFNETNKERRTIPVLRDKVASYLNCTWVDFQFKKKIEFVYQPGLTCPHNSYCDSQ